MMQLGFLLDQQVVDRKGQLMGKVDGIVLEISPGQQPKVARLVIGGGAAARRVHPRLGEWVQRRRRFWGPKRDEAVEVPWSKVLKVGIDVKVDLDAEHTPALAWEHWIRDRIIGRIPGA